MGLYLEAACKRKIWSGMLTKQFKRTAKHRKRHCNCSSLCPSLLQAHPLIGTISGFPRKVTISG
jgi:hypothetical protein